MGQPIFVLTTIVDNGENRPVAVVTDENVANQWVREGNDNDWIPFELDDVETTSLAKGTVTPFKPKPAQPTVEAMQEAMTNMQRANTQLQDLVEKLTEQLKQKNKKRGSMNPLLQKE